MKRLFILALLSVACFVTSGCVSGWIVAGGKNYNHLKKNRTQVEKVRKCFGEPAWRRDYSPPVTLRETGEYRSWQEARNWPPFVWGVKDKADDALVASCEVYKVNELLQDSQRAAVYFMAVGMSLGVAELADPFYIPGAIKWRREHAHDVSWLTYWFDETGHYAGFFHGDIRKPEITEQPAAQVQSEGAPSD